MSKDRRKSNLSLEDLMDLRGDLETLGDDDLQQIVNEFIDLRQTADEQASQLNQMMEDTYIDGITGLATAKVLDQELYRSLSIAKRYQRTSALVLLAIDDYRNLYDTFGEFTLTQVVKHIGNLLRQNTRAHDVIARTAKDEFAVLLNEISDEKDSAKRADMLAEVVATKPCIAGGQSILVGMSVGYCHFDAEMENTEQILEAATDDLQNRRSNNA